LRSVIVELASAYRVQRPAVVDPLSIPVDVPDLEGLAGEIPRVDDSIGIDGSKTSLQIDDARRAILEDHPGEVSKDVVGRGVDHEDRFHQWSVAGVGRARQPEP
jgi:hypothetical protein